MADFFCYQVLKSKKYVSNRITVDIGVDLSVICELLHGTSQNKTKIERVFVPAAQDDGIESGENRCVLTTSLHFVRLAAFNLSACRKSSLFVRRATDDQHSLITKQRRQYRRLFLFYRF